MNVVQNVVSGSQLFSILKRMTQQFVKKNKIQKSFFVANLQENVFFGRIFISFLFNILKPKIIFEQKWIVY